MSTNIGTDLADIEARLLADTDRKIAAVREEMKEREPSVLGAVRTFTADLWSWHRNERQDFPRSAAIGLAFAYLRPRVVLALGSISAFAIAIAQVWLIKGQNEMIAEQGRLAKAQIVGTIVKELRDQSPTDTSNSALISAFGDAAFDVVVEIVTSKFEPRAFLFAESENAPNDRMWINSALIVAGRTHRLSAAQITSLRNNSLHMYINARTAPLASAAVTATEPPTQPSEVNAATLEAKSKQRTAYLRDVVLPYATVFIRVSSEHPPKSSDYAGADHFEKADLLASVASYYDLELKLSRADGVVFGTETTIQMESHLTALCRAMGGKRLVDSLGGHLTETLSGQALEAGRSSTITSLVYMWCGMREYSEVTGWETWRDIADRFPEPV
jgi:hypothetical protein